MCILDPYQENILYFTYIPIIECTISLLNLAYKNPANLGRDITKFLDCVKK